MDETRKPAPGGSLDIDHPTKTLQPSPLRKILLVASVATGIQFGWALQLSLLTPYVQLLGVPHIWSAFIWLCGPISGMLVQPAVGYYSDRSTSRFGRRRPFIVVGAALVSVAVSLIGFSADIGHASGDPATPGSTKPRAIAVFVVGFWVLDVANNTLQGPCRALLADMADGDERRTRTANSAFSFFMAVGNVFGFAAGSYRGIHRLFPFTNTAACDAYCANLKSCFLISVFLLLTLTAVASYFTPETPITNAPSSASSVPVLGALRGLDRPMWVLMLVTCLNWMAWFPFILFDTDWMGKEVYGGKVGDRSYDLGVRAGALGLMINSVVLGATSLAIEPLARVVGGAKRLWGMVNLVLAICLAMMVVVTKMAVHDRHQAVLAGGVAPTSPPGNVKAGALALFSLLGIPLSITYSIPFALASIFSTNSGAGQGLSLGVLNLAIVVPQILVSATSGPWDALFGGGNLPAFVAGAVAAATSAVLAFTVLPSPPPDIKISGPAGGH